MRVVSVSVAHRWCAKALLVGRKAGQAGQAAHLSLVTALLTVLGAACLDSPATAADDTVDFSRDIRPILSNHCFQCHGPDDEARQGELRLDQRDKAVAKRGDNPAENRAAIVPGDPDASALHHRIASEDPDERMPPPEFGKPLSDAQIAKLRSWIAQGAKYDEHWAFQPLSNSVPPMAGDSAAINSIDSFVLEKLRPHRFGLSAPASRPTVIRRVHLDLLGLPPSVEDVDAFVSDSRPNAYERMLDAALSSPRFGERWGRHWLDQARYADSHGYTNDNARSIWPYRDWVIRALNRDLPFDQFTIEQLAGDLLPEPSMSQRVATGFHRNTLINSEGGTKTDQFRDEQVKDRTDTTGLVWMGLTVGCAKCHAHKFDPISQAEYYQLYAFFNSTADANSVTPTIQVPSESQRRKLKQLAARKDELANQLANDNQRRQRQSKWEASLPALAEQEAMAADDFPWTVVELSGKSLQGSVLKAQEDESLLVSGPPQAKEEFHATTFSPLTKIRSVRLEALVDESLPMKGPGRADNGNFVLSEFWFRTGDGRELRFSAAYAEHSQAKFEVAQAVDGKQDTGWSIGGAPEGSLNRSRVAWFVLPETLEVELEHALTFKMQFHDADPTHSLGRFRISISDQVWVNRPTAKQLAPLALLARDKRSKGQQRKLEDAFLAQDPVLGPVKRELTQVSNEHESLQRALPITMVLAELEKPRQAHVQTRGEFLRISQPVEPRTPAVLPPISDRDDDSNELNRLDLARWLVRPDHPLTARVRVNRIWMRLFGRGLVETENDFGIQGDAPTHPELFDWLSREFIRQQWSTKQLLRTIMMSATYRQGSAVRPELHAVDPLNQLLGRQNRIRVEAEIVRDVALFVSDQLGTTMGGPGVHPPQPQGVYAFTQRKKNWTTSAGEGRYRRGMYTFFYRSAPYPMLTTFDAPKFNATCTRRDRSNTPLQSLTIANSDAMFELAQKLAQRVIDATRDTDAAGPDERRFQMLFRWCLARLPDESETKILSAYLNDARGTFDTELGAWTAVARVMLNLDEFITRE